jgi:hypothetical protein
MSLTSSAAAAATTAAAVAEEDVEEADSPQSFLRLDNANAHLMLREGRAFLQALGLTAELILETPKVA